MSKKTIKDIQIEDKTILVRVDFNVPLKDGQISDDNRIVAAIPTIKYLLDNNAKVVLCSHLGKIKNEEDKEKNNLKVVVPRLSELLGVEVKFSNEVVGESTSNLIKGLKRGEVLLLQNTRFEPGESKNDPDLASKLSEGIDVFVNDAFGSSHRKHASTYGVVEVLKGEGKESAIGFLVEKEVKALNRCVEAKIKPFIAVLGGAKVSDKIKVIDGLLEKADKLIIGGAMSYTFLKALGYEIGKSRVEEDQIEYAKNCLDKAKGKIILPIDHIIADDFQNPTKINVSMDQNINEEYLGVDIGPRTINYFKEELNGSKMVFWNGPMGVFEVDNFANGTKEIAKAIGSLENAFSVIGGGDSAAASKKFGFSELFSHISTGGGASLEMIENDGHLPGIDIIKDKQGEHNED